MWTGICDEDNCESYQKRIEAILSPYNVSVVWKRDATYYGIDHSCNFFEILEEMLDDPDLFLSMVFCNDSHIEVGGDEYHDMDEMTEEKDGYKLFVRGN